MLMLLRDNDKFNECLFRLSSNLSILCTTTMQSTGMLHTGYRLERSIRSGGRLALAMCPTQLYYSSLVNTSVH